VLITVASAYGDTKDFSVPSMKEATKAAASAAKALSQIAEHETAAAQAKQKLLDTIGVDADAEKPTAKSAKPQQANESNEEMRASLDR
jgi:hypothetical protein